jgi:hypothetical protein
MTDLTNHASPITRAQRAAAFEESKAILALENMIAPADYAQLRQYVIDGHLTIEQAIEQILAKATTKAIATNAQKR